MQTGKINNARSNLAVRRLDCGLGNLHHHRELLSFRTQPPLACHFLRSGRGLLLHAHRSHTLKTSFPGVDREGVRIGQATQEGRGTAITPRISSQRVERHPGLFPDASSTTSPSHAHPAGLQSHGSQRGDVCLLGAISACHALEEGEHHCHLGAGGWRCNSCDVTSCDVTSCDVTSCDVTSRAVLRRVGRPRELPRPRWRPDQDCDSVRS
ncbi:unnamed protein product [Rangifer tarandus platyrhynchus]|uniref:Uncharacterized protein n=1 Tax=Rangifer tarandus platyrhynchus TaxID=3082113 RepID=A0AC59YAG7_RANTA